MARSSAILQEIEGQELQFIDANGEFSAESYISTSNDLNNTYYGNKADVIDEQDTTNLGHDASGSDGFVISKIMSEASNPSVCLFHMLFKFITIIFYLFGSFIFGGWSGDFLFTFTICAFLLALDFWTVKNVTGRKLVRLRWWCETDSNGQQQWRFESYTGEKVNNVDKTLFWSVLYAWTIIWSILFVVELLRFEFEWLILISIACSLSLANLIGYSKASSVNENMKVNPTKNLAEWAISNTIRMMAKVSNNA